MALIKTIEVTCACCGTLHKVTVPAEGYNRWVMGQARIQDAMPTVSVDDRELLMSHLCPRCWDKLFEE